MPLRIASFACLLTATMIAWVPWAVPVRADYPDKPIKLIVPQAPGSATDTVARILANALGSEIGQTIVIENKPGANAVIGTDTVAKAAPDGYTFGTVIAAHSVNPSLNPKLPYDTMKDFTYVSLTSVAPLILIATPALPAKDMKEFIALAKSKPGQLNFASSGIGSAAVITATTVDVRGAASSRERQAHPGHAYVGSGVRGTVGSVNTDGSFTLAVSSANASTAVPAGTYTVTTTGASYHDGSSTCLVAGAVVKVLGTLSGTTLAATVLDVDRCAGQQHAEQHGKR